MQQTILQLIERETNSTFSKRGSKEFHGPCPFCRCENSQFIVFATGVNERYWCRGCDRKGDAIQFIRDHKNMSYSEAVEYLGMPSRYIDNNDNNGNGDNGDNNDNGRVNRQSTAPLSLLSPLPAWVDPARSFLSHSQSRLMSNAGAKANAWLQSRGLQPDTIAGYGLGYNDRDHYVDRESWGLPSEMGDNGRPKNLWLPRGVVIPWLVDGELWGLRIRRPVGNPKYYWVPGGTANLLYNADAITTGAPVVLLEGEIDALTIAQSGYVAVATGSTHAARRTRWLARLSLASTVLIAYDSDDAGNSAANYWLDALSNARRWRPYWSDANQLQQDGVNIAGWVAAGLSAYQYSGNDGNNDNGGNDGNGRAEQSLPPVAPVRKILPQRYHDLIGRPLMRDDASELRAIAAVNGIDLNWQRIELN